MSPGTPDGQHISYSYKYGAKRSPVSPVEIEEDEEARKETISLIPNVNKKGLKGGVIYQDGQFDDARMAISLALTASQEGACLLNYINVIGINKENNLITGVTIKNEVSGLEKEIKGKVVINATGVFSDEIVALDFPESKPKIRPSQGVHLVMEKNE